MTISFSSTHFRPHLVELVFIARAVWPTHSSFLSTIFFSSHSNPWEKPAKSSPQKPHQKHGGSVDSKKRNCPVTPKADPPFSSSGPCVPLPSPRSFFSSTTSSPSRWLPTLPNPPCWFLVPSLLHPRWTGHSGYLPTRRSRAAAGGPAV